MPDYRYTAIDETGKINRGMIVALDEADVEKRLSRERLTLIKSVPVSPDSFFDRALSNKSVKPRVLIEFYYRLSQALGLGIPLMSALEENAKSLPSIQMKKTINSLQVAIEGGKTLYEAMSLSPKTFHKLDLGLVRIGEQSGVLPRTMKELADFLEWKEDIRSTLKKAAIYPMFIIIVLTAVIGVWVGYVLPNMASIFKEMGVALPAVTRLLLNLSIFFQSNFIWIIGFVFLVGLSLYVFQKTDDGKILVHKYSLKIPLFGDISSNIVLARLTHNFATMFGAGMSLNNIFEILLDNVLGNHYMESMLKHVYIEIQRGKSISGGFESTGSFPSFLLGAVRNGEMTGTLDESFKRLGDYYDAEVKRSVQMMMNAVEPITILLLGGVFGLIALSIMMPLYDVISEVGKSY